ncbi:MAG: hypothetical protein IPM40_21100 [Gammaproteobacteria bacterium]|nr:hypothetical protein [Gammaproteobacteria bacterium]
MATALLGRTKNGEPRVLSIVGEAYVELQKAHARDSTDELTKNDWKDLLVFRSPTKPSQHFVGFMSQWKAAREAAGLWHPGDKDRHVKFHTTRVTPREAISVQNGIDLYTVQKCWGTRRRTSTAVQPFAGGAPDRGGGVGLGQERTQ